MDETTLVLIRHAHVDNDKNRPRMCGWLDLPLSSTGELQLQCFRNESSALSPAVWEQYRPAPFTATEVIWSRDAPRHLLSFNVSQWWRGFQRHAE